MGQRKPISSKTLKHTSPKYTNKNTNHFFTCILLHQANTEEILVK